MYFLLVGSFVLPRWHVWTGTGRGDLAKDCKLETHRPKEGQIQNLLERGTLLGPEGRSVARPGEGLEPGPGGLWGPRPASRSSPCPHAHRRSLPVFPLHSAWLCALPTRTNNLTSGHLQPARVPAAQRQPQDEDTEQPDLCHVPASGPTHRGQEHTREGWRCLLPSQCGPRCHLWPVPSGLLRKRRRSPWPGRLPSTPGSPGLNGESWGNGRCRGVPTVRSTQ